MRSGSQVRRFFLAFAVLMLVAVCVLNAPANGILTNSSTVTHFGAAIGNGTTDDTAAMRAFLSGATPGTTVLCDGSKSYKISGAVTISKSITIRGACKFNQVTTNTPAIIITSSNVTLDGLVLNGAQHAIHNANEDAIRAIGISAAAPMTGLVLKNLKISNWGAEGIHCQFVSGFEIGSNTISNVWYAGIGMSSVQQGDVHNNNVSNVPANGTIGTNAYGIYVSRATSSNTATYPRSVDVNVHGNTVNGVPTWECYDTHGGQKISFVGNHGYNCRVGIMAGASVDASGNAVYGAVDVTIAKNVLDSGVTYGSTNCNGTTQTGCPGYGIVVTGTGNSKKVVEYGTGTVTGNVVRNYGHAGNRISGAGYFYDTRGLTVAGNTFINPASNGLNFYWNNVGAQATNNTFIDLWDTSSSQAVNVVVYPNSVQVSGTQVIVSGTSHNPHICSIGLNVTADPSNAVQLGTNNFAACATPVRSLARSLKGYLLRY